MNFKHKFLLLTKDLKTKTKDGTQYMVVSLFSTTFKAIDIYVPAEKIVLFNDWEPETYKELEFSFRKAYGSNDSLNIVPVQAK